MRLPLSWPDHRPKVPSPNTSTLRAGISTDAFCGGHANFKHIVGDLDGNLIVGSPGRVHFPLIDVREFCLDQSIINSASVPDLECVAFPLGTRFSFSCQLLHKHVLGPALRDWIESAQGEGATGREKHPLLLPETWR